MYEDRILTPKERPEPRINGARVFGVRPESPFLFKVPATGKKPLQYSAQNLPEGLKIDSKTGIIRGKITKRGTFEAKLTLDIILDKVGLCRAVSSETRLCAPSQFCNV